MTIECIDGFSSYNATSGVGSLTSGSKWSFTSQTAWTFTTPTVGGRGVVASGAATFPRMNKTFTQTANLAVGFVFRLTGLASVNAAQNILSIGRANGAAIAQTTQTQIHLRINTNGSVDAIRSVSDATTTTVLGSTAAGVIIDGIEHFIELEAVISDTVGRVTLWVDGVQVLNLTSQDTNGQAAANADWLCFAAATTSAVTVMVAHFWLRTDAATVVGHQLRVDAIVPAYDGSHLDFLPSTGTDHFDMVDDLPFSSATYLQGSSVGEYDLLGLSDLTTNPTTIYAIQVVGWLNKTDATTRAMALGIKSGTTQSDGSNVTLTTTITIATRILETNPDTGGAWTPSTVAPSNLLAAPKVTV